MDTVAAFVVWLLFYIYRFVINDMALGAESWSWDIPSYSLMLSLFSFPATAIAVHALSGSYITSRPISRITELTTTAVATFVISIIIYFAMLVDDQVVNYKTYIYSFFVLWSLFFAITYLLRLCYITILFRRARKGIAPRNVAIIGYGKMANKALSYIDQSKANMNRRFAGFISVQSRSNNAADRVIGSVDELEKTIADNRISLVIMAIDNAPDDLTFSIINRLIRCNVEIKIAPKQTEIITGRVTVDSVSTEPFINITMLNMPAWQQAVKRAFDITASTILGVLLSPLLLYIGISIKSGSKGSVIYSQERIGRSGKPFMIYKFRTMYTDAEELGPALTTNDDPRTTPFGKVLRKYRMDELPQLWNIIKGDMSIVGPRPERRYFIDRIEKTAPYYPLIYRVRPGLLSWGPIKIGYADTIEKMVERLDYDIVYVDNMNLILDVKIMLYSLRVIFNGEGR